MLANLRTRRVRCSYHFTQSVFVDKRRDMKSVMDEAQKHYEAFMRKDLPKETQTGEVK